MNYSDMRLVSSNLVSDLGSVDSADSLSHSVVGEILHLLRCSVVVVVPSLSMITETMSVLHTEIKVL